MLDAKEKICHLLWIKVGQTRDYSARYKEDIYLFSM